MIGWHRLCQQFSSAAGARDCHRCHAAAAKIAISRHVNFHVNFTAYLAHPPPSRTPGGSGSTVRVAVRSAMDTARRLGERW